MTPVTPSSVCDMQGERELFAVWHKSKFGRAFTKWVPEQGRFAWDLTQELWNAWQARAALAERTQQEALTDAQAHTALGARGYREAYDAGYRAATSAANSTAQPSDEQIRRLFVEHGHIYAGWLELGRAILALAAPTQAPMQPSDDQSLCMFTPGHAEWEGRRTFTATSPPTLDHDIQTMIAAYTISPDAGRFPALRELVLAAIDYGRLATRAPTEAAILPSDDKWQRYELWHSLAKANNTNAYLVRDIVLGYLEALAAPTQAAPAAVTTFSEAWEQMVKRGYSYSDANVEKVRMGWDLAMGVLANEAPASQAAGGEDMPAELFDGSGVYRMLKPDAQRRTSAENVSDVLDAVVRLMNCTKDAAPAAAVEPCPICFEDAPHQGTCGSSDPRALCNRAAAAPEGLTASHVAEVVPYSTPSGKRVALLTEHQALPIGTKLYLHATPDAKTAEEREPEGETK